MKLKFEAITWMDHNNYIHSEWRSKEELEQLDEYKVVTLGIVVKETDKFVTVAATKSENGRYLGELCILKGTIVGRQKFKVKV